MENLSNQPSVQAEIAELLHLEANHVLVAQQEVRVTATPESSIGNLTKETRSALNDLLGEHGLTISIIKPQPEKVIAAKFGESEILDQAA